MHFHPREDLLSKEPSLDVDFRRSIDEPRQVDSHGVSLVSGSILHKVVWQELVITNVKASISDGLLISLLLLQMVVVVFEEVRLLVTLLELLKADSFLLFILFVAKTAANDRDWKSTV